MRKSSCMRAGPDVRTEQGKGAPHKQGWAGQGGGAGVAPTVRAPSAPATNSRQCLFLLRVTFRVGAARDTLGMDIWMRPAQRVRVCACVCVRACVCACMRVCA